jgi:two-component system, OmpR family, sensor kinase
VSGRPVVRRLPGSPRGPLAGARLRLPIRVKLATVSAVLTFVILLLFAIVIGLFTQQKLRSSFDSDLRATAADLQSQFQVRGFEVRVDPSTGELEPNIDPELFRLAATGGAVVRVFDRVNGRIYQLPGAPDLGALYEGVRDVGNYRVVSRPLFVDSIGGATGGFDATPRPLDGTVAAVQYGKPTDNLEATIGRVRLFLLLGVLVGTGLAFVAGFVVARRAMRPISGLTKAAREVARTRDPARTALPRPEANDEVAELATTLSDMLGELDAARSETEATLRRQRQFVADASHELRTPLTSILANLELLEEELRRPSGPRDSDAAADTARSALRSSRRMRRLVGDLLLLARADAGRRERPRPVDLAAVVAEAAREASVVGGDHPLTLDLPAEPGAATVDGSHDDLHRLALNLVENAFLHTPAGTPVVASVRCEDGAVVLEVADRGPGVPASQRKRVFERFARADGDRAPAAGSGLGLAIVSAVADAHGGAAAVRDADGGGALFEVRLPAVAIRSADAGVAGGEHDRPREPKGARQP